MPDIYLRSTQASPTDIGLCDPTVPCPAAVPGSGGVLPPFQRTYRKPYRQRLSYALHAFAERLLIVIHPLEFVIKRAERRKTALMNARELLGISGGLGDFGKSVLMDAIDTSEFKGLRDSLR